MFQANQPFRPLTRLAACAVAMAGLLTTHVHASSSSIPPASGIAMERREVGPEAQLLAIYRDLGHNRLQESLEKANRLVKAYPTFKLGHVLLGDLLLMHATPVTRFGADPNAPDAQRRELIAEATARIRTLQEQPDPELVPRAVMQMSNELKNVFVIDTTRSRMYLYQNNGGQLRFKTDYYITQGKLGANKVKEGDQRTPVGVYYINGYIPGAKLPDFYGPGAFPINYPNEWDRRLKRDGHGIWLHGVPADTYSRPPLASDGCVVLSNDDFRKIMEEAEVGKSVVIIGEHIEFIARDAQEKDSHSLQQLPGQWQKAVASGNADTLQSLYSNEFRSHRGDSRLTWIDNQYRQGQSRRLGDATMRDVSMFHYPGNGEMVVATFTLDTGSKKNNPVKKRLYWKKEGTSWKIIYEGPAA